MPTIGALNFSVSTVLFFSWDRCAVEEEIKRTVGCELKERAEFLVFVCPRNRSNLFSVRLTRNVRNNLAIPPIQNCVGAGRTLAPAFTGNICHLIDNSACIRAAVLGPC